MSMLDALRGFLMGVILKKGELDMMAMFFATKVILGTLTWAQVPAKLKPAVKAILIENDVGYLAEDPPVNP